MRSSPLPHSTQHSHTCVVIYSTKFALYEAAHYRIRHNALIHVVTYSTKITLYTAAHYRIRHNTPIHLVTYSTKITLYTAAHYSIRHNTPIHVVTFTTKITKLQNNSTKIFQLQNNNQCTQQYKQTSFFLKSKIICIYKLALIVTAKSHVLKYLYFLHP